MTIYKTADGRYLGFEALLREFILGKRQDHDPANERFIPPYAEFHDWVIEAKDAGLIEEIEVETR